MSQLKDPRIKLFGKTIQLPEAPHDDSSSPDLHNSLPPDANFIEAGDQHQSGKSLTAPIESHPNEEDRVESLPLEEFKDSNTTPSVTEDTNAPSADSDAASVKLSKPEEDQSAISDTQEKTLKKPDKILPCPRCNSMDTKFCYFNNYNVNQPRHFCKNCQRYWTAGGTMRNVPVGAGRRKNKNSISQFRNITMPEALHGTREDLPNGIHHTGLSPNGTVLTFSSESPLCESMVSVLNIVDKSIRNGPTNGVLNQEGGGIQLPHGSTEKEDDYSNRSSVSAANSKNQGVTTGGPKLVPNCHPFPPQVPCFPGAPWPYPWNWGTAPVSPPNFAPTNFPVPFYSTAPPYWGCAIPGAWNVPLIIPPRPTAQQTQAAPCSGPNSPTLGKHSRDDKRENAKEVEEEILKESNSEKCLWVPKTLRIDDPGDAAKSSIWATLGIKNDTAESGLFKAFQPQLKSDEKTKAPETSTVLQANPAALSRSLSFHESS